MDIRDVDCTDVATLREVYRVECEATRSTRPDWVPLGEDARTAVWQSEPGWEHRLVGAYDLDALVGFASCSTAQDTPDTSWVDVSVIPGGRRHGLGSELAQAAEARCPDRVDRFVARVFRPTRTAMDQLVREFAEPLGYACSSEETVVELDLDLAELPDLTGLSDFSGAPDAPAPAGYTVSTYVDGVPPALRRQVGAIKGALDAEATHGDLAWQATELSEQDYADDLALWKRQGRTAVEAVAIDRHGDVAAWTALVLPAEGSTRPAQTEGTLVTTPHRGHGLGRAVKVASLRLARERRRGLRVRTSSDDQNVWMRAINDELGFVPVEFEVILQKQRDRERR